MIDPPVSFVLCGGLGTRLRSAVSDRPKSMAPVAGRPFLELLLADLRRQGIRRAVLGTGYLSEQVRDHFGDGSGVGLGIGYSVETEPLGTGGALRLAASELSDPALVLNGDSFVDFELSALTRTLRETDASFVMALQAVPDVGRYGSVTLGEEGRVEAFVEKGGASGPGLINAGVYLVRREAIDAIPEGRKVSLETEVLPGLIGRSLRGVVCSGRFIDIGVPEDYRRAQTLLAAD
jgi:NDP-sugar pyrophosphorylase family protein